jgi:hypothetical protein
MFELLLLCNHRNEVKISKLMEETSLQLHKWLHIDYDKFIYVTQHASKSG